MSTDQQEDHPEILQVCSRICLQLVKYFGNFLDGHISHPYGAREDGNFLKHRITESSYVLHRYIATCSLFLAVTQAAVAQLTEEGSAKVSAPSLRVSIQGPTGPVPIGTKQVLVAGHDSVALPRYEWVAHCLKKDKDGELKEHEPHRTQADWNKIQIKDCWGYESIVRYRVDINHATVGIGLGDLR